MDLNLVNSFELEKQIFVLIFLAKLARWGGGVRGRAWITVQGVWVQLRGLEKYYKERIIYIHKLYNTLCILILCILNEK